MIDARPCSLADLAQVEAGRRPNIVLVVLDCVGQAAVDDLEKAPGGLRLPPRLAQQFVRFDRSVSSGSWTLPSHASLLTGLPPWEHGVHGRGAWRLPTGVSTLAEELSRGGYATACISSNGFLGPANGLSRGFEEAHVGSWAEAITRGGYRVQSPVNFRPATTDGGETSSEAAQGAEFASILRRFFMRYPGVLDSTARNLHAMFFPGRPYDLRVSPWIEPTFRRWLATVKPERPVFCFFNFLDAHEPYFREDHIVRTFRERARYAVTSQDQTDYCVRPKPPGAPSTRMLHDLYLDRVRFLLERVGALAEILVESQRWDDTLLILTADHGQAFGENGAMFHGLSIEDAVLRVPLWVRFPGGNGGGRSSKAWTSSLDVAATIRASATERGPAASLARPGSADGRRPVASISDGVTEIATSARFPARTRALLDHVLVAVYAEDRKVSYDACHDRVVGTEPSRSRSPAGSEELAWAREIGGKMLGARARKMDRLSSWGYD